MSNKPLSSAAIQQINMSYNALHDRLMLRLGMDDKTEVCIWLTRRLVKVLWKMLEDEDLLPATAPDVFTPANQPVLQAVAKEIVQQQTTQKMDFSETYLPNREALTQEPLLPSEFRLIKRQDGLKTLEFLSLEGAQVKMPLTKEIVNALTNMLQLSIKEATWDLSFVQSQLLFSDPGARPVLH